MAAATLSAVIPTLNAAATLPDTLRALAGRVDEIVVADAGSRDGTAALASAAGARVMTGMQGGDMRGGGVRGGGVRGGGVRGRGAQVAAAAAASRGEWLLLLHADTVPAPGWRAAAAGIGADFVARRLSPGGSADLLAMVHRWHGEGRTVIAVLHDLDLVRREFPETLLLARDCLGWGATGEVLTAANRLRARMMAEAWSAEPEACERRDAA